MKVRGRTLKKLGCSIDVCKLIGKKLANSCLRYFLQSRILKDKSTIDLINFLIEEILSSQYVEKVIKKLRIANDSLNIVLIIEYLPDMYPKGR